MHGDLGDHFTPGNKRPARRAHARSAGAEKALAPAALERLEARQLLTAVVVAPTAAPVVGTTALAPMPDKTFWVNGLGTNDPWNLASSITPNTTNDLVLNVAPFASLYNACCEGADGPPGSTAQAGQLLTNGLLQNQIGAFPSSGAVAATGSGGISDASSGANVLSDLDDSTWWMAFNLGGQPGVTASATGYDISEIDSITGHQDFRTGQNTDIMVQFVGASDWSSLSFGQNFNFTQDQNGAILDRGAAQMAVVNNGGGPMASNVRAVKFIASNANTWYRELVVTGTASSALPSAPGPSLPTNLTVANNSNNPGNVDVTWKDGAATIATMASEFQILRAQVVSGVTGSFATVGTILGRGPGASETFTDTSTAAGTYVYKIIAFNSFNGGALSTGAASPPISVHLLPAVLSIARTSPAGPVVNGGTVSYTVTFNQAVTGVDAADFGLALTGSVTATTPVVVSGSGAVYTVTVNGITGSGSVGLNLLDNGSIHDVGRTMSFATQSQALTAGAHPRSVAAADVSGDGKPDLVIANFSGNAVAVLLGNGNGTFAPQQTYAVGSVHTYAMNVVVQDINGDGKKDILVASTGANGEVSVLLGNGDGTFQAQKTFAAGPNTYALAVADVNGDGKMDIAVADNSSQIASVGILLGNGNGAFQAMQTVSSGAYAQSIAAGDVTGDGKQDLVVGLYAANAVSVMAGNGNGTFKNPATFNAGTQPTSVGISDVTGDNKPDLVVTDFGSGNVGILNGNANGTFAGVRSISAGAGAFSVAVLDVNADAKPDLVVANDAGTGAVAVLLGNGSGIFQAAQTYAFGNSPVSVAIADVNGDGKPDLIGANLNGDNVSVLIDNSNMAFVGQIYTVLPLLNTIGGTAGNDQITLTRDADGTHVDWTMGAASGQMSVNDPAGLTINGNGGSDVITLIGTSGNPLPGTLHLNGTFTLSGLGTVNPLAGTSLDIEQSTVYVFYGGSASPAATIQQYLTNGYNGGAWNGTPTVSTGVITSTSAATGPANSFGVGFADWTDGVVAGQPANTIELRYTRIGDANLDRIVDINDANRLRANWNAAGSPAWDRGNFNFDAAVDGSDALLLGRNYGASATGTITSAAAPGTALAAIGATPANQALIPATTLSPPTAPASILTDGQNDRNQSRTGKHLKKRR